MEVSKKETSKKAKDEKPSLLADIPLGLSSALARNVEAMRVFAQLPDDKREAIINGAHGISSKAEMREYVANFTRRVF